MARLLDTTPDFVAYAKMAAPEAPWLRENLWEEHYRSVFAEVFEAYAREQGNPDPKHLARRLYAVRERVEKAASLWPGILAEAEPRVRDLLDAGEVPAPLHVLMAGTFTTNAFVGRLGSDPAVFWCLEWFSSPDAARVLVAHETTHAFHQELLGAPPKDHDLAWTCLYEGLAIQTSRQAFPGRPEADYFWYGLASAGDDWVPWCQEHRSELFDRLRKAMSDEDPDAAGTLFAEGDVEGRWRTGYFLADQLVGGLSRPLADLARLDPDEAREAIRAALSAVA